MSSEKSNAMANLLRDEGNKFFAKKDYLYALIFYNKSICFALPGSEALGLAYANRSAVYLEMKWYEKCIDNIKWAQENAYPADKLTKLIEREKACNDSMDNATTAEPDIEDDPLSFFKLSYPANEKIPSIVNCLELRENKKYGRYIVTTSDLKVGDIIAIEKPFCSFLENKKYSTRCTNCSKYNKLSLIPCSSCTEGKRFKFHSCAISLRNNCFM